MPLAMQCFVKLVAAGHALLRETSRLPFACNSDAGVRERAAISLTQ